MVVIGWRVADNGGDWWNSSPMAAASGRTVAEECRSGRHIQTTTEPGQLAGTDQQTMDGEDDAKPTEMATEMVRMAKLLEWSEQPEMAEEWLDGAMSGRSCNDGGQTNDGGRNDDGDGDNQRQKWSERHMKDGDGDSDGDADAGY